MSDDTTGTGEATATTTADPSTTEAAAEKTPQYEGDFDKERHERALAAARAGEKKARDEAKAERERVAAILKAAGLAPDGKEDPAEQLKAAVAARDTAATKARQNAIELAVYKRAGKAGADPDAILDSRAFTDAVKDLDPDAGDFGDKVADAIKAAVKGNPRLAAEKAAGKVGAAHNGSGGSGSIDEQIAAAEKAGDWQAVIGLKRQKSGFSTT